MNGLLFTLQAATYSYELKRALISLAQHQCCAISCIPTASGAIAGYLLHHYQVLIYRLLELHHASASLIIIRRVRSTLLYKIAQHVMLCYLEIIVYTIISCIRDYVSYTTQNTSRCVLYKHTASSMLCIIRYA